MFYNFKAELCLRNSARCRDVSVRNIKYLIRGGRLSAAKGLIARILNINPIVSIDESGKAIVFDKAFNQRANMGKVMAHIRKVSSKKSI